MPTVEHTPGDTSQKFSNLEILKAFFTGNTDTLRENGYNPKSLYESSQLSFDDKQPIRGRTQCRIMTRFKPTESEAPVYEKSGDLLSNNGLPKQAHEHWKIAFDNEHKPFDMTMNLGQHSLKQGDLNTASRAFSYLTQKMPHVPYVHNELGVTQFMLAARQNSPVEFVKHRLDALSSFDRASQLQADPVVTQNHKVASLLTIAPLYSRPFSYLEFNKGSSTRMIDAFMRDLANNQHKTESSTGIGLAPVSHPEGGGTSISPVITTTTYTVPNVPNQQALYELNKLKQEQLSEEESTRRMKIG